MAENLHTGDHSPFLSDELKTAKKKTAFLSVLSNSVLVILKLGIGLAIGSVSIISEAIHSGIDLFAAVIAFVSVRKSSEPPDICHTFGHGKFEDISGLVEAVLIVVAALIIIAEAAEKLLGAESTFATEYLFIGIGVMAFSALINTFVSSRLMRVARETESIALESDAWHLRTDVYTSLGVFAGLVLIHVTGLLILDSLVAIGIAAVIFKTAWDLIKRSFDHLVDRSLPEDEEQRIRRIICEHCTDFAEFHDLRTRRSGGDRFIDFHLCVTGDRTVAEAHDLTDHLESDLRLEFPRSFITIHVEPCTESGDLSGSFCHFDS